ncbi:acetyltransferase [Desulfofustis glycolicus]|uniref:Sugar O-acyltransferase, sialic acid O-acetyltransferase NeuD family n=1 Tax=Desulfofustis glycolicus DSM 9705 TaxID=1121409 RepID=A0A1M5VPS6_9BACT|nr:acetyltransferase [Desulfofustis glycolicus]SHH77259.1 sugar O-acyltransferase, sialic acid O-acetyltransferase NeuD family [Desulfofustis glycolicus DSM 9705]
MKRLLIIGAGGFGREVLNYALDIPLQDRDWKVGGFLDSNLGVLSGYDCAKSVLADPMHYQPKDDDCFICAIGNPDRKIQICDSLVNKGGNFITLIHPSAVIGRRCSIGQGCIICPGAIITTDVKIGDFVSVNVHASIGHDTIVGKGCTLSGHVDITGFAVVEEGVFLGSHAVVLPKAKVGAYAIIGAGSVVLKRVKSGATVMGVPAKQVSGF